MIRKVNLAEKFNLFSEQWTPKVAGELNDSYVKLAKLEGEFVWHQHAEEDELFLVVQGTLRIQLREQAEIVLHPGEFVIIPRGVEHRPVADEEAQILLLEPKATKHTGNVETERTVHELEWV
jgi:quercetin dioxygenase-like cupin family protein